METLREVAAIQERRAKELEEALEGERGERVAEREGWEEERRRTEAHAKAQRQELLRVKLVAAGAAERARGAQAAAELAR